MGIREKIVARANAIVGMTRVQLNMAGDYAWCAHTVSEVLRYVGINNMYDLSCTRLQGKMAVSSEWYEPEDNPIPGDIIFFDWDHKKEELPLDHVGIVVAFNGGTITYVNGNGNDSFRVTRQTININNSSIAYWMRFIEKKSNNTTTTTPKTDPLPTPAKKMCTVELEQLSYGCKSPSVETMQNLLLDLDYKIEVDGMFGDNTKKVLGEFQKKNNLTVDYICGAKTWKALIESV